MNRDPTADYGWVWLLASARTEIDVPQAHDGSKRRPVAAPRHRKGFAACEPHQV